MRNLSGTADKNLFVSNKFLFGAFFVAPERSKKMSYQLKEVAERIRTLREIAGLSESQMAQNTGVSLEEYVELEKGNSDFGFSFIYKCADVFNVEMKDLLEGSSPNLSLYTVTRKGEGLSIVKQTGFIYDNLAPRFKGKAVEPLFVKIPYSDDEPVFSSHEGQEIDIVIKGKIRIQIGLRIDFPYTAVKNPVDMVGGQHAVLISGLLSGPGNRKHHVGSSGRPVIGRICHSVCPL
jgi:transcriptional regulator with XRE-family HTH domain